MKKFFAALYLIGVNGVPNLRDVWAYEMHAISLLKKIMSRNRFLSIMANRHYLDTTTYYGIDNITIVNGVYPFWTVKELIQKLSNISESLLSFNIAYQ